jgi:hypothetical protein
MRLPQVPGRSPSAERQKALLQFPAGQSWPPVVREHCTQHARTAAAARPAEGVLNGAEIEETEHLRPVDGALDLATLGVIAEIDQSAGHARAGDSVDTGDVGLGERGAPVGINALSSSAV